MFNFGSGFGATRPAVFGTQPSSFGAPTSTGPLFGGAPAAGVQPVQQTQQTGMSLFGHPVTSAAPTTGMFGSTPTALVHPLQQTMPAGTGMGAGGTTIKFNPPIAQDTVQRGGTTNTVNTKHICLTAMKEYENKSLEELRLEDYSVNRRGGTGMSTVGGTTGNLFGTGTTGQASIGGQFAFGQGIVQPSTSTGILFSNPAAGAGAAGTGGLTAGGTMFGSTGATTAGGAMGLFGTTGSFGQPQQSGVVGMGQPKPLFGAAGSTAGTLFPTAGQTVPQQGTGGFSFGQPAASQPSSIFGSTGQTGSIFGGATSGLGFGQSQQQQPAPGTVFGAVTGSAVNKPMFGALGAPVGAAGNPATSQGFGTGHLFGQTTTTSSIFGVKPTTTTSAMTSTGLFGTGVSSTGFAPGVGTGTTFGFGGTLGMGTMQQPAAGLGLFGAAQKPAGTTGMGGLFPNTQVKPTGFGVVPATTQAGFGVGTAGPLFCTPGALFGVPAVQTTQQQVNKPLFGPSVSAGAPAPGLFGTTATTAFGATGSAFGGGSVLPGPGTTMPLTGLGGYFGGGQLSQPLVQQQGFGLAGTGGCGFGGAVGFNQPLQQQQQLGLGSGSLAIGPGLFGLGSGSAADTSQQLLDLVRSNPYGQLNAGLMREPLGTLAALQPTCTTATTEAQRVAAAAAHVRLLTRPVSRPKTRLLPANRKLLFTGFDEDEDASSLSVANNEFFVPRNDWKRLTIPPTLRASMLDRSRASLSGRDISTTQQEQDDEEETGPAQESDEGRPKLTLPVTSSAASPAGSRKGSLRSSIQVPITAVSGMAASPISNNCNKVPSLASIPPAAAPSPSPPNRTSPATSTPAVTVTSSTSPPPLGKQQRDQRPSPTAVTARQALADPSLLDDADDLEMTQLGAGDISRMPADSPTLTSPHRQPHPCGIRLTKPGYYILPTLEELAEMGDATHCWVENLVIGRQGYGRIQFPGRVDIAGTNVDAHVHIRRKEVTVYPDDTNKPPVGQGLNRHAEVTLDSVWPTDKTTREPVTDTNRLAAMRFDERLERATVRMGARFIDYQPQTGSWIFEVKHFSKYRYDDSDEEQDQGAVGGELVAPVMPTGECTKLQASVEMDRVTSTTTLGAQAVRKAPTATATGTGRQARHFHRDEAAEADDDGSVCMLVDSTDVPVEEQTLPRNRNDRASTRPATKRPGVTMTSPVASVPADSPTSPGDESTSFRVARGLNVPSAVVQRMKLSLFHDGDMDEEDWGDDGLEEDYSFYSQRKKTKTTQPPPATLSALTMLPDSTTVSARLPPPRQSVQPGVREAEFRPPAATTSSHRPFKPILAEPPCEGVLILSGLRPTDFPFRVSAARIPPHLKLAPCVPHFPYRFLYGTAGPSRLAGLDAGIMSGHRYRAGWTKADKVVTIARSQVGPTPSGQSVSAPSRFSLFTTTAVSAQQTGGAIVPQIGATLNLMSVPSGVRQGITEIEELLQAALKTSVYQFEDPDHDNGTMEVESGDPGSMFAPLWLPQAGLAPLDAYSDILLRETPAVGDLSYHLARLISLCQALWGRLGDSAESVEAPNEGARTFLVRLARKQALSEWIRQEVSCSVSAVLSEERETDQQQPGRSNAKARGPTTVGRSVFTCMTGGELDRAVQLAQSHGEHRLALLLAQAGGSALIRRMLLQQLNMWLSHEMDLYIPDHILRTYALIAGQTTWLRSNGESVHVLSGLDWLRALGAHLWFACPYEASIEDALVGYKREFKSGDADVAAPLPPGSEAARPRPDRIWDCAYHLLQTYCKPGRHRLDRLLDPRTISTEHQHASLIDWAPVWHLYRVLASLNMTANASFSQARRSQLHCEMASQMERAGLWHWAVFALLHLPHQVQRNAAVRALIDRHVTISRRVPVPEGEEGVAGPDGATCTAGFSREELFVTEQLRVPSRWVHEAKAVLARNRGWYKTEAHHWFQASQYELAHRTCLTHLLPDLLIAGLPARILRLLQPFTTTAVYGARDAASWVRGWEVGGGLYLDHCRLRLELTRLTDLPTDGDDSEGLVEQGLGRMRVQLDSLCERLHRMPAATPKERLCKQEMSATCSRLLHMFLTSSTKNKKQVEAGVTHLVRLLLEMDLPEDHCMAELRRLSDLQLRE